MSDQQLLAVFKRNSDGSWTALQTVEIGGTTLSAGASFTQGEMYNGLDIAKPLNAAAAKFPHLVITA